MNKTNSLTKESKTERATSLMLKIITNAKLKKGNMEDAFWAYQKHYLDGQMDVMV